MTKDEVKSQAEWISEFMFIKCCMCGVDFASPLLENRAKDGELFYCPVGHEQFFSKAREDRDRKRLEAKRKLAEEQELYRLMHPAPAVETPAEAKKERWWP